MAEVKVGVIGGSGLYEMEGLTGVDEVDVDTPFGKPSDAIVTGKLEGVSVAFLPRHGRGHRILPTEVPSRANIYALKLLGVEHIIAVCSVGSLKEEIRPGDLVVPDQLIDRTTRRTNSFFGEGIVAHVSFAVPFCPVLSRVIYQAARDSGVDVYRRGTNVVIEGPAFSTRAESRLYCSWGADIIGMTALPEAKLAREAELCYAVLASATDYDCWMERVEPVTVEMIFNTQQQSIYDIKTIIRLAVARIPQERNCSCPRALENTIVTSPYCIPAEQRERLDLLIGKYLDKGSGK